VIELNALTIVMSQLNRTTGKEEMVNCRVIKQEFYKMEGEFMVFDIETIFDLMKDDKAEIIKKISLILLKQNLRN
jgi:hypothetical protein